MAWKNVRCMVSVLALTVAAGCAETPIVNVGGEPIAPDCYRPQIVAIDAILYEDGPLSAADRDGLEKAFVALSEAASADNATMAVKAMGMNARTLAGLARRAPNGMVRLDSRLRDLWFRVRGSMFDDAAWFRRSSADPIEPAIAGPPPPSALRPPTAEERRGLEDTLDSLARLVAQAKDDLPNGVESEAHLVFARDAQAEVAIDAERLGPEPPGFGIDMSYKSSYRHAAEALKDMKMLASVGAGTPRSSREYLIGKVEEHLGIAREHLAEAR